MGDILSWLWFLIPFGVGVMAFREYTFAKLCFAISGLLLAWKVIMEVHRWLGVPVGWRLVVVVVACGLVGGCVYASWIWADRKHNEEDQKNPVATAKAPIKINPVEEDEQTRQPVAKRQPEGSLSLKVRSEPASTRSGSVTMQAQSHGAYSPNVIGNNNQITINPAVPHRHLGADRNTVIESARVVNGKAKVFAIMGNQEAAEFAQEIYDSLREAGWQMEEPAVKPFMHFGDVTPGVTIGSFGVSPAPGAPMATIPSDYLAARVIVALQSANVKGLSLHIYRDQPLDEVQVFVGLNPDSSNTTPQ